MPKRTSDSSSSDEYPLPLKKQSTDKNNVSNTGMNNEEKGIEKDNVNGIFRFFVITNQILNTFINWTPKVFNTKEEADSFMSEFKKGK